jgi:precorrin-6A/cobalt-precorrin-6A reductase
MIDLAGSVLVLGGTAEARALAAALVTTGRRVISSLAGRVRDPALPPGEVRIGGFRTAGLDGVGGLAGFVLARRIAVVVDATHPYAATISAHAAAAVTRTGTPLLRLERPGWSDHRDANRWSWVATTEEAVRVGADFERPFLTTGRQSLAAFLPWSDQAVTVRVVDPPDLALPDRWCLIRSRGPYAYADEHALMRSARTDLLVTKDSGGTHTAAKLDAARDLGIAVIVIARPPAAAEVDRVPTVDAALDWLHARDLG